MFCPDCGTQNQDTSKFCSQCGRTLQTMLPTPSPPPAYGQPPAPATALAPAAIGGLSGLVGSALIMLGWALLFPWSFHGVNNSVQFLCPLATNDLPDELFSNDLVFFSILLALALPLVVLSIPYFGVLCAQISGRLFERWIHRGKGFTYNMQIDLKQLQSRTTIVLVMVFLLLVFVFVSPFIDTILSAMAQVDVRLRSFVSTIPFLDRALFGEGYYLMVAGALLALLGALFARSREGISQTGKSAGDNSALSREQEAHGNGRFGEK